MSDNFTHEHKLVEDISTQGWLANPAGRQGYEVVILEQIGDGGSRYYCSLKPGETLRLSERVLGKFTARAVDVRHARAFEVGGQFGARERGRKVTLRAKVRYRVTDARVVAMETLDPLGELRDKVISTLNRDLSSHPEANINPGLIERIIRNVGEVAYLGLMVEDAEVIEFTPDSRLTGQTVSREDLEHEVSINTIRERAELESLSRQHSTIDLSNINVLMHKYPDLIPQIFGTFAERDRRLLEAQMNVVGPAIQAYIEQQKEDGNIIDPEEIARIMRQAIAPPMPLHNPVGQIVWGDDAIDVTPQRSQISFSEDDDEQDEPTQDKKPPKDLPRIKFSD